MYVAGMKFNRKSFLLLLAAILTSALLAEMWGSDDHMSFKPLAVEVTVSGVSEKLDIKSGKVDGAGTSEADMLSKSEISKVIETNSTILSSTDVDSLEQSQEIGRLVKRLDKKGLQQVLDIAQSEHKAINQRILATYILMNSRAAGVEFLQQLAEKDLEIRKLKGPHSTDEIRGAQEKAIRVMAIDGLVSQAENIDMAKRNLKRVIQRAPKPMQRYAEKKLRDLE